MTVQRGEVYRATPANREFLVITIDAVNASGSVIVVEVTDDGPEWSGARHLLSVPLPEGKLALCWRVNWLRAERLGEKTGQVPAELVDRVVATVKAAIEP